MKECTKCGQVKSLSLFGNDKKFKDGKASQCKSCFKLYLNDFRSNTNNEITKRYEKTPKGFLVRTYRNMLSRVQGKVKAHIYAGFEILDKNVFYSWALNDKSFCALFEQWEASNYSRKITPSIDRIKSDMGYSLTNIRWITHSNNSSLGSISRWNHG